MKILQTLEFKNSGGLILYSFFTVCKNEYQPVRINAMA